MKILLGSLFLILAVGACLFAKWLEGGLDEESIDDAIIHMRERGEL